MKVVILAGGRGTRLAEETGVLPKPMVEIGGRPILWHIMKLYSHYGHNEFVICLGYKGQVIRNYFANYWQHQNCTVHTAGGCGYQHGPVEDWHIDLIDTGQDTMTGGRIAAVKGRLNNEPFFLTYGDGVADIDLDALVEFHNENDRLCTVTTVQPEGRFGVIETEDDGECVTRFSEKPRGDGTWINAGFFVCEPGVFDYIDDSPQAIFEHDPMREMVLDGELYAYRHTGFWKPMDTLGDKMQLEELWKTNPQWKVWE